MGIIYKHTNKENGKLYIGITKHSIKERKWGGYSAKFQKAINKHGWDSFVSEVIEEVDNKLLNSREVYWVNYYNSYKEGYNSTRGGLRNNGDAHMKPINQYDIEGNLLQEFVSIMEASKKIGTSASAISSCCARKKNRKTAGGYQWRFTNDCKDITKTTLNRKKVKQYSLSGKLINTYSSIGQATKEVGINHIGSCCNGEFSSMGGYIWVYNGNEDSVFEIIEKYKQSPEGGISNRNKKVYQEDIKGNILGVYKSLKDLHEKTKFSKGYICKSIKNNTTAYGCKWRYEC